MGNNVITLDLGTHKAGGPVSFDFIDHFDSKIKDVKGSCGCQTQSFNLVREGENNGKPLFSYQLKGQITTRPQKAEDTFKMLTITLENGQAKYFKFTYKTVV